MELELRLPGAVLTSIYIEAGRGPVAVGSATANAPTLTRLQSWLTDIWGTIQDAMTDVYQEGEARIDLWVERIREKLDVAKRELGEQTGELMAMLQGNLLRAARAAHSALLRLLPMSLEVEAGEAGLRELTVQYQLAVGADVVASVAAALRMSSGATVSVAAKYTLT